MERVKRRWWTASVSVLASLVVAAAVLSGLFQLAVLALPGYREQLSDYVSKVADRPIDIGGIALVWYRLRPQLELDDIVLYSDDGETPALSAEQLRIGFGLMRLLRGDTFPNQIELAGLQVVVEIDADNQVHLRGLDTAGRAKAQHDWRRDLGRFDSIRLEDCVVTVDDARLAGGLPRFRLVQAEAQRRLGGASLEASVELPGFMGDSAEFEARIRGDLDRPDDWQGRWSLSLEQLKRLPWLEARLPGRPRVQLTDADLSIGGDIEQGRLTGADITLDASRIEASRGERQAQIGKVDFAASLHRDGRSWTLEVPALRLSGASGDWPSTRLHLQYTPLGQQAGGGSELQADADFLRLQDLAPWLMLADDPSMARLGGVSGQLRHLVGRGTVGGNAPPRYSLRAQLDGLGYAPKDDAPGFSGLQGELSATETGGRLAMTGQPFELQAARVFAQPLRFDRLDGALDWTRDAQGWQVSMPAFGWALEGTQGEGDLQLTLPTEPGASPEIKLGARFSAADAVRLKPYMPVYWSRSLHDWLDRAIVAGRVPQGRLTLQGPLRQFPFRDGDGLFQLDLDVADARLAYSPDWPAAEQVAAQLQFRGNGLSITSESGKLAGNRIEKLVATIADFRDAVLTIDGEVDGEAARYYEFLRASPLARRLSGLLNRTQVSGIASTTVRLTIPLREVARTDVSGVVRLKGVDLQYQGLDEPFVGLEGELAYDNNGVTAPAVTGSFLGVPATAALAPVAAGNTRLSAEFDYTLQPDGSRLSRYVPAVLRPYLSGQSHYRVEIVLGSQSEGLIVSSDLRGIDVDLPPPIGKPADQLVPLTVQIGSGAPDVEVAAGTVPEPQPLPLTVRYGERLAAGIELLAADGGALQARRVLVDVGSGRIPTPTQPGVHVTGRVDELELGDWIATLGRSTVERAGDVVADTASGADALRLQSIELHADQLHYQGYSVGGVQIGYRPAANGGWSATVAGDGAEGTLDWQSAPSRGLVARLSKLKVRSAMRRSNEPGAAAAAGPMPPAEPLDPTRLPTLDIDVEDLRIGDVRAGHLQLASERIGAGQRLTQLRASGADVDLEGSGEWRRSGTGSAASLNFVLDTRSISDLLDGFGYARNVTAQRSRFAGELVWPMAAAGLELAQAQGHIDLDLERGSFSAVEPGAGRVLGLLNVLALPRRLLLDFRDVVSKGLGFDRAKGRFNAAGGNASTDDLQIQSPSLKIDLRGRIGLAARDYDQRITVYPDVSGGVTLGALLLGGPALGAIALVAQEVLDKPLDQVTQLSYRVTGSWDNPQVKRAE